MVQLGNRWVSSKTVDQGDVVKFLDEGEWKESQFKNPDGTKKNQFVMTVGVKGSEMQMALNKTNREAMIVAYGKETKEWIGKTAIINLENALVAGKRTVCVILCPPLDQPTTKWDTDEETS